jgi:hypothetical protein
MRVGGHCLSVRAPHRKAVLKPPQSKRWREGPAAANRAKRLDCGAFTAAFFPDSRPREAGATSSGPFGESIAPVRAMFSLFPQPGFEAQ